MSTSLAHPLSLIHAEHPSDAWILRDQMRSHMRTQRRAISASEQHHVAQQLARWISRTRLLRAGSRVGVYLPHGREADLSIAIARGRARGCYLYLPRITHMRRRRMEFVEFAPGTALRENAYGILEPIARRGAHISIRRLDLILVPLVAVDARGWRLGSGAGFYDRRLSHLSRKRLWRRPRLIGVGYEFQRVESLPPSRWDVPVEGLITETGFHALRPWAPA
jgi:5-formyltetrahydrofolate cyclo-ligase